MKRALSMIRAGLHYRREIFQKGLEKNGYSVQYNTFDPKPDDVLIIWNRYGHYNTIAETFERVGAAVLVAENGYLGKDWNGGTWYAISKNHHNGGGRFPNICNVSCLSRFRIDITSHSKSNGLSEIILLPQRGIGHRDVAMPRDWPRGWEKWLPSDYRVRRHPGKHEGGVPLEHDLSNARCVVTWGSGAALKAIVMGIPCVHCFKNWIGAPASTYIKDVKDWDNIPYIDPQPMLNRLSWAMWEAKEIESGEAFHTLLNDC